MATQTEKQAQENPALKAVSADMLQTLGEVAFVATACGLWNHAEDIFNGIKAVRPWSELPVISQALARMSVFDDGRAIELLSNEALAINPDNEIAKAFLGMALKRCGFAQKAQETLEEVVENASDERAVEVAKTVMAEKF